MVAKGRCGKSCEFVEFVRRVNRVAEILCVNIQSNHSSLSVLNGFGRNCVFESFISFVLGCVV